MVSRLELTIDRSDESISVAGHPVYCESEIILFKTEAVDWDAPSPPDARGWPVETGFQAWPAGTPEPPPGPVAVEFTGPSGGPGFQITEPEQLRDIARWLNLIADEIERGTMEV